MAFSRTALIAASIAVLAGGGYGLWQYGREVGPQTANVAETLQPTPDAPAMIAGEWVSQDDTAYEVAFAGDGSVVELYEGEPVSTGTYSFAASPDGYTDLEHDPEHPHAFLLEEIDGERYAYRVTVLTSERLELTYLERGNTLTFTRR